MFSDFEIAKKLQEDEYNGHQMPKNSKQSKKDSTKENVVSLIDPTWELIDPNPNIHSLFIAFDKKYFWNTLGSVEVKWSPRMYSCAGICTYKGRGGCVVSLSLPLLQLRPRKDLIETLLHEMIHAYLFLTNNDRDRDGHGPKFHSHMYRINKEAGTNISVYHTFHDEVRHYRTHWWRCDGPCRDRKPFFGIVKRAMNRAPGPNDMWFAQHQATCGGNFIKIQEPEGFKSRKKKAEKDKNITSKETPPLRKVPAPTVSNFFNNPKKVLQPLNNGVSLKTNGFGKPKKLDFPSTSSEPPQFRKPVVKPSISSPQIVNKINNTNNIHGFGSLTGGTTGGLKSNKGATLIENPKTTGKGNELPKGNVEAMPPPITPFSGKGYVLSQGTVNDRSKSKLLSLYLPPPPKKSKLEEPGEVPVVNKPLQQTPKFVSCPVCALDVISSKINDHLDSCVGVDVPDEPIDVKRLPPSPEKSLFVGCPICGKSVYKNKINDHLDDCMNNSFDDFSDVPAASTSSIPSDPPSPDKGLFAKCPVCDMKVFKNKMDDHLDSCIRLDSIMDQTSGEIIDLIEEETSEEVCCPCCNKLFPPSDLNAHLDKCLSYKDFE